MSLKEEHDDEDLATERFKASLSKFIFSTPPVTAQDNSSEVPNSRRSVRAATSQNLVKPDVLPSPSRMGKRKASDGSPSKNSTKKLKRGYAPPETYAHLSPLTDYLAYGLDVVFCGIKWVGYYFISHSLMTKPCYASPGYMSAQKGHHFANPTNHFWKCLHQSGFTSRLLPPSEDYSLPVSFNIGLTNLVDRPSAEASELSSSERISSVPVLLAKLALHRPRFLCLVGTSNWDVVRKALLSMSTGPSSRAATKNIGLQPFKICYPPMAGPSSDTSADTNETLLFVVPSTSGRVVQYQLPDKIELFSELKKLVDKPSSEIDTSEMKRITVSTPRSTKTKGISQDI
ncbi:DNA glycosylase [Rhizopogon vinicolor AM-OR11-026]|uniref:DNA glycosylase n=1 Tax=Rhizopogon vinicolor AM-OR11-026 TaxID=1314800 RepID=A0A1B7MNH8_9AGAM|nr:DNA glycosylase [Rhizopogon vinicolor AM-OR11-026]